VNFEIQGSGGEMAKLSINRMWRNNSRAYWVKGLPDGISFCFPVHDEMDTLVNIDKNTISNLQYLHGEMIKRYSTMTIPLESELSIGDSFGTLRKVGTVIDPEKVQKIIQEITEDKL